MIELRQLAFTFPRRFTLPPYRVSWKEHGVTIVLEVGARCHDESWPWWQTGVPW